MTCSQTEGQARQEQEVGPERPIAPNGQDHTPILRATHRGQCRAGACQAGMTGTSRGSVP